MVACTLVLPKLCREQECLRTVEKILLCFVTALSHSMQNLEGNVFREFSVIQTITLCHRDAVQSYIGHLSKNTNLTSNFMFFIESVCPTLS